MSVYFKENFRVFDVLDFIALVTSHIPPKHKQLIRRYGLYSSRSRSKWEEQEHIVRRAPVGWKEKKELEAVSEEVSLENTESSTSFIPVCGLGREDEVREFYREYTAKKDLAAQAISMALEWLTINSRMREENG